MNYRVKRINNDDELFHSDLFLGSEFSDELYHWKYVKKKKVNGKWRYYYDAESLKKDVNDTLGITAKERMNKNQQDLNAAKKDMEGLNSTLAKNEKDRSKYKNRVDVLDERWHKADFEAGFDRGIEKHSQRQILRDYGDNLAKIPKDVIDDHLEVSRRAEASQKKADDYKNALDNNKKFFEESEAKLSKTRKGVHYTQNAINQLEKDYARNKSEYEKSIIGRIDKGKAAVTNWFKRVKRKR